MDHMNEAMSHSVPKREYRPPNGESWCDLHQRVKTFVEQIITTYVRYTHKVELVNKSNQAQILE